MKMTKTYTELAQIDDYFKRFEYLKLGGSIGKMTFGGNRYLNQAFYTSPEWRSFRRDIILRDKGCDMAFEGIEISGELLIIHHINPIRIEDILNRSEGLFNPENVVAVSELTHKAIHYGDMSLLPRLCPLERVPNDTCPWR